MFREEMSLIVDVPSVGHRNSNDGKTACRAFSDPETFSRINGVNIVLIKQLYNVLLAVCSGYHLDIPVFEEYCLDTVKFIIEHYSWYVMPPTLQKLLIHGAQIADRLDPSIGQYSM